MLLPQFMQTWIATAGLVTGIPRHQTILLQIILEEILTIISIIAEAKVTALGGQVNGTLILHQKSMKNILHLSEVPDK